MSSYPASLKAFANSSARKNLLLADHPLETIRQVSKLLSYDGLIGERVKFSLDFSTLKYSSVDTSSNQLLGYSPNYFMSGGIDSFIGRWEREDFELYNEKIFPACLSHIQSMTFENAVNVLFSNTFRIHTKKGAIITLLQRNYFIPDIASGFPIAAVGTIEDISHFKTDKSCILSIEDLTAPQESRLMYKRRFLSRDISSDFSKRELEVLRLMSDGLSSKQIASNMKISIHTVNIHRKNMLQKSSACNSNELIHLAISQGYI